MRHVAQQTFAADPQTVHAARDFAMQALDGWGGCRRGDDIRLCVSELAGNAVQHGSPDGRTYLVRLIRHPYCLHVEVHDSARHSRVRIPARFAERGSRARHAHRPRAVRRLGSAGPHRPRQGRPGLLPPARGPRLTLLLHTLTATTTPPGVRPPSTSHPNGDRHGTVLAARPPLRRHDRTLPHPRTPPGTPLVCRTAAPPHASEVQRHVDRRQ
ncbi:ATP-binding protein [Streptomyces sp. NPDC001307]|uniref:ATP-binding protein n=1 Tax=Streptomyces sp. NPDC001307 TaxID=3364560 RepID=UPI003677C534